VLLALLLSACTPQRSYEVQSFFFDGVPDPNAVQAKMVLDSLAMVIDSTTILKPIVKKLDFTLHEPYLKRECNLCHDRESMDKTRKPLPELCNDCHISFEKQFANLHGPVSNGYCIECHAPHKSKYGKLLDIKGQDLCFKCHLDTDIVENKIHIDLDLEEQTCIDCHNPHGSQSAAFLDDTACFKCHDNFIEQKIVVHGPVGAGLCSTCHDNHEATTAKLLVQEGNDLCFNCHKDSMVQNTSYHSSSEESCVSCHNPHASNYPYMLKTPN